MRCSFSRSRPVLRSGRSSERIGSAELAGVRRQREEWAREASRLFARGKVEEALDAYAREGRIFAAESRADVVERIVADWTDARRDLNPEHCR
jgi:ATP-dependent exoDNAse (exonuclease V) alpha subunit